MAVLKCYKWKLLNNNDRNQVFWACKNDHPLQTIILMKTVGQ